MFEFNNVDFSEIKNAISQTKEGCEDTVCVDDLIFFLQEQVLVLEDECYERDSGKDFFNEEE